MKSGEHKTAAQIVVFIISFYLMWSLVEYMVNLPETLGNYWKAWLLALINYILGSWGYSRSLKAFLIEF